MVVKERNDSRMFEKGEYVVYGTSGVCKVEDITTMNLEGISKEKLFYILSPLGQSGGRIFTPVDNQKTLMRPILSLEEARDLIKDIPQIEGLWIVNDKQREETYRKCMRDCDCRGWIKIIKTLYLRKIERTAQGKKVTATDEKYLKLAENHLYSELSIPLEIPKERMEAYITEQIEKA